MVVYVLLYVCYNSKIWYVLSTFLDVLACSPFSFLSWRSIPTSINQPAGWLHQTVAIYLWITQMADRLVWTTSVVAMPPQDTCAAIINIKKNHMNPRYAFFYNLFTSSSFPSFFFITSSFYLLVHKYYSHPCLSPTCSILLLTLLNQNQKTTFCTCHPVGPICPLQRVWWCCKQDPWGPQRFSTFWGTYSPLYISPTYPPSAIFLSLWLMLYPPFILHDPKVEGFWAFELLLNSVFLPCFVSLLIASRFLIYFISFLYVSSSSLPVLLSLAFLLLVWS